MNRHTAFLELAAVGLDFRLTGPEQARLDGHLATCPVCRARVEGLRADARAIAGLPEPRLDPRRAARILDAALRGPTRSPVPVLRLALVAALIGALAIGAALVGAELLRRMTDDELSVIPPVPTASPAPEASAPPDNGVGASWVRVELPEAGVPDPGGATMTGVIAGGPGAIAWGWAYGLEPRIWTTADGLVWERATVEAPTNPDPDILEPGVVNDIAAGGPGYVAVGFYTRAETGRRGLVWTSVDGRTWDLVPYDPVFESAYVESAVAWQGELIATGFVSYGPDDGGGDQLMWTSADGRRWDRAAPVVPAGLRMSGSIVASDGLWTAGVPVDIDTEGTWTQAKYLTSTDGRAWSISGLPRYPGPFYATNDKLLTIVAPWDDTQSDRPEPGVYRTVDHERWDWLAPVIDGTANDLVEVGGTLVLVGHDGPQSQSHCYWEPTRDTDCAAASWRSVDGGSAWWKASAATPLGTMVSVAALADGSLVAVGTLQDVDGSPSPAAWVSIPRSAPPASPGVDPSPVLPPAVPPTPLPDSVALPSATITVTRGAVGEQRWIDLVDPADPAATTRLVDGADPVWTPDGESVVYACPAEGNDGDFAGICSVDATRPDAGPTPLVSEGDRPSISPDGTRMTVHRGMIDLGATWLAGIDGSGLRELGPGDFDRWSPDAASLLGMSEISGGIALRDPDGGDERVLVGGRDPAWSPDGRLIAFSNWDESAGSVRTVDPVSGTVAVRFTAPAGDEVGTPTWLPDGPLVFVMAGDLWRLDPGSDRPAQLTAGLRIGVEHLANPLDVSPDGDWIAFISDDPSGGRVGIAAVDGGWRILDLGPDPVTQLAWRPSDG